MLRLLLNFAKHRALPAEVFGDVPYLHEEMRLPGKRRRGEGRFNTGEPGEAIARSHGEGV